jgi:bacterioferritin-associated ferredoxin
MYVCSCLAVKEREIQNAIRENNATTLEELQELTQAGTCCGNCCEELEEILESESSAALAGSSAPSSKRCA